MTHSRHPSPRVADLATGQLHRLVMLRWLSVAAMALSALGLPPLLDVSVRLGPLLAVATAMAAINLFTLAWLAARRVPQSGAPFVHLLIDVLGWSAFLYLAGGATNPLISLLLPLVAIGAAVLPAVQAWLLAATAVVAYSLLWSFHHPIRVHDAAMAGYWHLSGMWLTFTLSACVIVAFVLRMTAALRERDRALADARAARERDERIVALANLAAGAAHSLGTPLGTLRILIGELLRTPGIDAALRGDLELMNEQVEHCRQTLGVLTARAGDPRAEGGAAHSVTDWIARTIAQWQRQRPHCRAAVACADALAGTRIVADATLTHALQTLVNNAADASPDSIAVEARQAGSQLLIDVVDRGPGVPEPLRATLGDVPVAERPAGMGIGLFLARAALARYGGSLSFEARSGGGTRARMQLPLERIQI
jgi:two-component system sensor histidine kinase RegB